MKFGRSKIHKQLSLFRRPRHRIFDVLRRHIREILVGSLVCGAVGYAASLYVPVIFSDFSRIAFSVRTDCYLPPSQIVINLVEPPDAYVVINFLDPNLRSKEEAAYDRFFQDSDCTKIEIRDETDAGISYFDWLYKPRPFLETITYEDGHLDGIPATAFDSSPWNVVLTKEKIRALHKEKGGNSESYGISIAFNAPNVLTRTSFSRSVLALFPGVVYEAEDPTYSERMLITVRAPRGYVFSSAVPEEPTQVISRQDGVIFIQYRHPLKEPGRILYFENAKGAALNEFALFLFSGVFGFGFGFLLERFLLRRR